MDTTFDMSGIDDIIIPDDNASEGAEDTSQPADVNVQAQGSPTPDTPPVVEDEPKEPEIDTSLSGVEGDPIDAPEGGDDKSEIYKTLAEALKEEGFFTAKESVDDITDLEKLASAFKDEIKKHEFEDLTETQRRVLEGFRNGIPEEEIIRHEKVMTQYNSITDDILAENEELQKAIYIADLMQKGISENRAQKMYEISYDTGELFQEAKASLDVLKQQEAAAYQQRMEQIKAQQIAQQKQIQARQEAIKKSIYDVDKFLDEVAVTENLKNKVYSAMNEVVGYTEDGIPLNKLAKARMEDPIGFETKLYYLFELTDGFSNIKKFNKHAESKASKKLESLINNNTFIKDSNQPAYKQDPNSYDADAIVELI